VTLIQKLRGESLSDSQNLPPSDVIAQEIVEALEVIGWRGAHGPDIARLIAGDLNGGITEPA
jgi:hypothetical protein